MDPRDQPPDVFKRAIGQPPFPDNLPIAEVSSISHKKILGGDASEINKLLESARTLGFFRVDFRESELGQQILKSANKMFQLSAQTFALPAETKMVDSWQKNPTTLLG
jgi:isopenicillin N synthase-like dioxygenase